MRRLNGYNRIFGAGPIGLFISVALLLVAIDLKSMFGIPQIFVDHETIRLFIFVVFAVICIMVVVWSLKSLNPLSRGKTLTTTGAFKYFRHPLYAAFITFFDFGLVILLNNWAFVFWAILLHPLWHILVKKEENMLGELFPNDYQGYCQVTGRFFPRLTMRKP